MPRASVNRDDRLELRVTREEKQLLAAAAAYQQLDVTSFVLRSALSAARKVVDQNERIILSARDTERVLALLDNPPKPTKALLAAARAYRAQTGGRVRHTGNRCQG